MLFQGRYKTPSPNSSFRVGRGVLYPPSVNGQPINPFQLFGGWEDLLVFRHAFGQHQAGGVSFAILKVLQIAAAYCCPNAP
jgi:hypothetical protein